MVRLQIAGRTSPRRDRNARPNQIPDLTIPNPILPPANGRGGADPGQPRPARRFRRPPLAQPGNRRQYDRYPLVGISRVGGRRLPVPRSLAARQTRSSRSLPSGRDRRHTALDTAGRDNLDRRIRIGRTIARTNVRPAASGMHATDRRGRPTQFGSHGTSFLWHGRSRRGIRDTDPGIRPALRPVGRRWILGHGSPVRASHANRLGPAPRHAKP
jgi:hypothetical protein